MILERLIVSAICSCGPKVHKLENNLIETHNPNTIHETKRPLLIEIAHEIYKCKR